MLIYSHALAQQSQLELSFLSPMFHFIIPLCRVGAAVCETMMKTNNDTQRRKWGLLLIG